MRNIVSALKKHSKPSSHKILGRQIRNNLHDAIFNCCSGESIASITDWDC
jgi:hypothetical protein